MAGELTSSLIRMGLAQLGEQPEYTTLAGGISSDVWRVDLKRGPVCLKRALPKLRVRVDWVVSVERNKYEIQWLRTGLRDSPAIGP